MWRLALGVRLPRFSNRRSASPRPVVLRPWSDPQIRTQHQGPSTKDKGPALTTRLPGNPCLNLLAQHRQRHRSPAEDGVVKAADIKLD